MYSELYEQSNNEIIRQIGKRYASYRKRLGLTQKQVVEKTGLSIFTISSFENGSFTGIKFSSLMRLLRAIEQLDEVEKIIPELPMSPRELFKKQSKR